MAVHPNLLNLAVKTITQELEACSSVMDHQEFSIMLGEIVNEIAASRGIVRREREWQELAAILVRDSWSEEQSRRCSELCKKLGVDESPLYEPKGN